MSLSSQVSALATRVGTEVKALWAAVNAKAPSASPTFTGTVSGPIFAATSQGAGTNFKVGNDAWIGDIDVANTFRVMGQQSNANGYIVFGNGNATALGRAGTGALTYGGSTIWHSGNDGASSGLDADLLDGQHGTYYATAASVTAKPDLFAQATQPAGMGNLDLWLDTSATA